MSSKYIRDQFKAFMSTQLPADSIIDITNNYDELDDFLDDNSLTHESSWLGLQFIASEEMPISIGSDNTKGCYRENGALFIHVVEPASSDAYTNLLNKADSLNNLFRGQRINEIIIESMTPPNFEDGSTLQFEGGFTSCSIIVNYERTFNL